MLIGTSAPVSIVVDPSTSTPPQISITSPTDGSIVTRKSTVAIQAAVTVGTFPIARVDFIVGSTVLCSLTMGPYNCDWTVPPSANKKYRIQANAVDTSGQLAGSTPVTVTAK